MSRQRESREARVIDFLGRSGTYSFARDATCSAKGSRQARGASTLEQVAEALRPRERRPGGLGEQLRGVHALGELSENGRDVGQAAGVARIADEVERRRFRRRVTQHATQGVLLHGRDLAHVGARHELDTHPAAADLGAVCGDDRLEDHGRLVGGAVQARRGEKPRVVGQPKVLHELRHELLSGQTPERPVLGRDDQVEAAKGHRHAPLLSQPADRRSSRDGRRARGGNSCLSREVVAPLGRQTVDVAADVHAKSPEVHGQDNAERFFYQPHPEHVFREPRQKLGAP